MKQISFTFILIFTFCVFSFAQNEKSLCPAIKLIGPDSILQIDKPAFFTVELSEEAKNFKVEYEWTVERGEIAGGQGTSQITVLPKIEGGNLKATIKIKGLPENCANTESDLIAIEVPPIGDPVKNYKKIPLEDEYVRLDSFMISLANDQSSDGVIHIMTDKDESINTVKKHIRLMMKHFKFRKFPKERIIFLIEKSVERRTLLWIVPEGAKYPNCENCEILKGKSL